MNKNYDKDKEAALVYGVFILICLIIILTCFLIYRSGEDNIKREAIINNVAEWKFDEKGRPEFRWKGVE
jgi:hypothetical protein